MQVETSASFSIKVDVKKTIVETVQPLCTCQQVTQEKRRYLYGTSSVSTTILTHLSLQHVHFLI